ncbi:hypothetical protein A3K64_03230 [Candidatus Micrarchaeota archaeon RBG_16_36_9]|nr:MAG: hypothetical protein A3K64_03230 [Candidatus Micrarchaeota archaeon RBG_16_36_9]
MKKIFICAPNKYKERTEKLAIKLEELGFQVTFAAKNTDQNMEKEKIFESDMKLIRKSDVFLCYFVNDGHYGIDFAVEVGKVSEMKKQMIGFVDVPKEELDKFKNNLEKDVMFKHSFSKFVWSFEELMKILKV